MFDLTIRDNIARLRLDRPERRNAIPVGGWSDLADAAVEARAAGARVLILGGSPGGAFCAGADLSDFHVMADHVAARSQFRLAMRRGLDELSNLPIPVVALIEGACYGAGVALAMAADIRIAGKDARFAITPAKFGISYPQEDVGRLVGLVGPGQASRLLFGAGAIDGAEAERIGLVDIYAERGATEEADRILVAIADNDRASLIALKRAVRLAEKGVSISDEQDREFDRLLGATAFHERLRTRRGA